MPSVTALGVLLTLGLAGCGGTAYEATGTSRAAGANASIEIEQHEGGNALITLDAKFMPPPDRLGQGLTTYVMWFVPQYGSPEKAATLAYDADSREGTAQATTVAKELEVRVTAESSPDASSPSDVVVIRQQVKIPD